MKKQTKKLEDLEIIIDFGVSGCDRGRDRDGDRGRDRDRDGSDSVFEIENDQLFNF